MIRNYFKIAWRNLLRHKGYSSINIAGLAMGMTVTMLIALWIWDELSFNKYHKNYDRVVQLWQFVTFEVNKIPYSTMPIPLAEELRSKYPDFKSVSVCSNNLNTVFAFGDRKFTRSGMYVEPDFVEMMSVHMIKGTGKELSAMNSILISRSLAQHLFDEDQALDKIILLDNKSTVTVAGVYDDFPENSTFNGVTFLASWQLYVSGNDYARRVKDEWDENSYRIFAQLQPEADLQEVSARIKDIRMKKNNPPAYKPEFFLHPMSDWKLYSSWRNGVQHGGKIEYVWLFGYIGAFILILACINFMNLSTARSEKRAKEVGVRSSIGSSRTQLIFQFFSESLVMAAIAFVTSLLVVQLCLPAFNSLAGKTIQMPWPSFTFWIAGVVFVLFTGLIAGSYPAFYLSSFKPVSVLKGAFRAGRLASVPRKVLVVLQFTVSVILIIGTIVVFRQVQHAKDRPSGYDRAGLIEIGMNTPELFGHYDALRNDLLNTGAVYEFCESSNSMTSSDGGTTAVTWSGKNPEQKPLLILNQVTHHFGKTIGWQLAEGRDFSVSHSTDSSAMILNETAVELMGLKQPLGETVNWGGKDYQVIGVVEDMIRESPFETVQPSFFVLNYNAAVIISIRLSPERGVHEALGKVQEVFRKHNPGSPFDFRFVDDDYAKKFLDEERISKLTTIFAVLAIFISCLGIFGLASFVAEQRTKEIGIRKVLGASVLRLWRMLSREFVTLVIFSLFISIPLAWYLMNDWLQHYDYRTDLSWWIFAASAAGALAITLLTVSYQSIKAALANPVNSLRSE
jgi:predicted permease